MKMKTTSATLRHSLRKAARIVERYAGGVDAVMILMALLLLKRASDARVNNC
jgi:hypothetical protein